MPRKNQVENPEKDMFDLTNQSIEKPWKSSTMRSKRSGLKSGRNPITFAEQRERQRQAEAAHMGPGAHDGHLIPFGVGVKGHVTMGSKYEFKPLG